MAKNIEIEFKCLIDETKFNEVIYKYSIKEESFFTQTNHYFYKKDQNFTSEAIRVRELNDTFEFTHKQKHKKHVLETNQFITKEQFKHLIFNKSVPLGDVYNVIKVKKLDYLTFSTTKRTTIPVKSGILFIDKTTFADYEDYELEYEVDNYDIGYEEFLQILAEFNIPYVPAEPKIKRALITKKG